MIREEKTECRSRYKGQYTINSLRLVKFSYMFHKRIQQPGNRHASGLVKETFFCFPGLINGALVRG